MAKTTKTFSLEGDIIDKIVKYKKDNSLSSDSAALERIMLAFNTDSCSSDEKIDNIEGLLSELLTRIDTNKKDCQVQEIKDIPTEKTEIINDKVDDAVNNIFSTMSD